MRPSLLAACSALILLMGCSTDTDRRAKSMPAPHGLADHQRWWKPMNDPLVDLLADQLVAQNIDMKIAVARMQEARGIRRTAASGFFPQIGLDGNASRGNRNSTQVDSIAQGGFDASWEIDLFGRVRHGYSAADARVGAAEANAEDVRNSMLAELVRAVIDWRQAQETLRVTKTLLASQDEQISLVRTRTDAGLVDNSELERALAQRQQTATQQPLAMAAAQAAQHQIERLLATEPNTLSDALKAHASDRIRYPQADDVLGIDISNLRHRPDLRAKRAALLASDADLSQAESDLWPKLTLGGFFGGQESSTGALIAGNPIWSIAAAISMPLLNFGKLRGAIDAADARAQQASLDYENATLSALQETHTALSDYLNGLNAVAQQQQSLEHRKTSVSLANERFTNGLSDMTDLTTAQSELDEATLTQINRQAAAAQAFVRLQKALGTAVSEAEPAPEATGTVEEEKPAPIVSKETPHDPNETTEAVPAEEPEKAMPAELPGAPAKETPDIQTTAPAAAPEVPVAITHDVVEPVTESPLPAPALTPTESMLTPAPSPAFELRMPSEDEPATMPITNFDEIDPNTMMGLDDEHLPAF